MLCKNVQGSKHHHLVVHSALNSHANYPNAHPATKVYGQVSAQCLGSQGLTDPVAQQLLSCLTAHDMCWLAGKGGERLH